MKRLIMCEGPNELEIMRILLENDKLISKSNITPKEFAKQHIRCGRKKYDNSTQFYNDYYGLNPDALVEKFKEYKRIKWAHKKDELYLADMLK